VAENENTLDTIRDLTHRVPFVPFRIVMTSGNRYTIENPETMAITETQIHYYLPKSDKVIHLRLNQIAAIEEPGKRPAA
jgi:hypothetical protein